LKNQYPNLFNIVRKKQATVADVLNSTPLNVSFRRALVGNKLLEWQSLVVRVAFINLNECRDTFVWNLNNNGLFSIKSMYKYLVNNEIKHMKVPLKIKIFLWFLKKGCYSQKTTLLKGIGIGVRLVVIVAYLKLSNTCFFIAIMPDFFGVLHLFFFGIFHPRNVNHLFNSWSKLGGSNHNHLLLTGVVAFCWAIWITRNDVVFDKGHPKTFLQVLFRGHTGYDFGLCCSARMTTRNRFVTLASY
jgi:hypothetical protein